MRSLAIIFLATALSGCAGTHRGVETTPVGGEAAQVQSQYEMGKAYFAQHQYGLALSAFRQALREDPGSARALNAVAACYDQMSRFDLADQYYNRALAANPESPETLNNIGYSHYQRSQNGYGIEYLESARAYLKRARSITGDNSVVAENMVRVSTALAQAGKQETEMAAAIPGFQFVSRDLYASWIERLSQSEVLVVTRPDPETAKLSRSLGLAPAVAALTARRSTVQERDVRLSCTAPQCLAEMPVLVGFLRDERPVRVAAVDAKDGRRILIAGLD